jgi:hypothetical protein
MRFYKLNDKGLPTDTVMSLAWAAYAWKRKESNNTYYDEEEGVDYLIDRVA